MRRLTASDRCAALSREIAMDTGAAGLSLAIIAAVAACGCGKDQAYNRPSEEKRIKEKEEKKTAKK